MIGFKWFKFGGRNAAAAPQYLTPENLETAAMPTNPNGQRVLIVDDDPVFVRATSMKLRAAGFRVRTARDPSEAIVALQDSPADTILLDINFPPDVSTAAWYFGMAFSSWIGCMACPLSETLASSWCPTRIPRNTAVALKN